MQRRQLGLIIVIDYGLNSYNAWKDHWSTFETGQQMYAKLVDMVNVNSFNDVGKLRGEVRACNAVWS